MKARFCISLAVMLAASSAAAEIARPGQVGSTRVLSSSQRFLVSGSNKIENLNAALWIEEAAGRVSPFVGSSYTIARGHPIRLEISSYGDTQQTTESTGGFEGGQIQQVIRISGFADIDQEQLLESFTDLLVRRALSQIRKSDLGEELYIRAPDWLTVGIAQNAVPDLRARNQYAVLRSWEEGGTERVTDVLSFVHLPSGRWKMKAFCGVFLDWLSSRPDWDTVRPRMLGHLSRGEPCTMSTFLSWIDDELTPKDVEQEWDLWIAATRQKKTLWSMYPGPAVDQLRETLQIDATMLGLTPGPEVPVLLSPKAMVSHRDEAWARTVATFIAAKLGALAIGQNDDVREVIDRYQVIFDALLWEPPKGWIARLFARPPSEEELLAMVDEADRELQQLDFRLLEKKNELDRYIDEVFNDADRLKGGPKAGRMSP